MYTERERERERENVCLSFIWNHASCGSMVQKPWMSLWMDSRNMRNFQFTRVIPRDKVNQGICVSHRNTPFQCAQNTAPRKSMKNRCRNYPQHVLLGGRINRCTAYSWVAFCVRRQTFYGVQRAVAVLTVFSTQCCVFLCAMQRRGQAATLRAHFLKLFKILCGLLRRNASSLRVYGVSDAFYTVCCGLIRSHAVTRSNTLQHQKAVGVNQA